MINTQEHALIYLHNHERKDSIVALLEAKKFRYTLIDDYDMDETIEDLFALSKKQMHRNQLFSFNFIIFKNVDAKEVLSFYTQTKEANIPFSHKAVLTDHNRKWSAFNLLEEIQQEHLFYTHWDFLHTLLKEANDLDATLFYKDSYLEYQKAYMNAYLYTQQPNPSKEQLASLITVILRTKKQSERKK